MIKQLFTKLDAIYNELKDMNSYLHLISTHLSTIEQQQTLPNYIPPYYYGSPFYEPNCDHITTTNHTTEEKIMNIYLAGPIFTIGDKFRNDYFYTKLKEAFPDADIYDPLQNTEINGVEGKKKFAGSQEVVNGDNARLDKTDVLVACIDGDIIPSGTACELGKFHEKIMRGDKKYIVGICTDNRQCALTHSEAKDKGGAASLGEQQYSYQNIYVTGIIKQGGTLVSNIEDAIAAVKNWEANA